MCPLGFPVTYQSVSGIQNNDDSTAATVAHRAREPDPPSCGLPVMFLPNNTAIPRLVTCSTGSAIQYRTSMPNSQSNSSSWAARIPPSGDVRRQSVKSMMHTLPPRLFTTYCLPSTWKRCSSFSLSTFWMSLQAAFVLHHQLSYTEVQIASWAGDVRTCCPSAGPCARTRGMFQPLPTPVSPTQR